MKFHISPWQLLGAFCWHRESSCSLGPTVPQWERTSRCDRDDEIAKPLGEWSLGAFHPARDGVVSERFGRVALLGVATLAAEAAALFAARCRPMTHGKTEAESYGGEKRSMAVNDVTLTQKQAPTGQRCL
ncbi:hypothetical protein IQ265_09385 [Nodosilinea sp. LEGE 06152]|nr:hypothetical protein [Nodosilinea sp. LEGE 06152]